FNVAAPAEPDLTPYQPSGWSGPIVLATQSGGTTSSSSFTSNDTLYVDWAVTNQGVGPVTNAFHTELLLDGNVVTTWSTNPPLDTGHYTSIQDFNLGKLSAGSHTLKIITDYQNEVGESNETNNTAT